LWSSTTEIKGKVTLNDDYEDLRHFFVDKLGVRTLTLQMVYDELLHTSPHSSIRDVKQALSSLNALLRTEQERPPPETLLDVSIFPVRLADGTAVLRSAARTEFAIIDREHLAEKFRGRIAMLDFSLEEVRRLQYFFDWMNLQHRYLSAAVKQFTSISPRDGCTRPITMPDRDLRRKAHALLR
jgi:hypothetical protein